MKLDATLYPGRDAELVVPVKVRNIGRGGVYVEAPSQSLADQKFFLFEFSFLGKAFKVNVKKCWEKIDTSEHSLGLQFYEIEPIDESFMEFFMNALRAKSQG